MNEESIKYQFCGELYNYDNFLLQCLKEAEI